MKRASFALSLALVASCGLVEKLTGDEPTSQARAKPGPPIAHEQLLQLLPTPEGWEASDSHGELQRLGDVDISRARTNYTMEADGETRRVTLEIVDGNNSSSLHTPFAMFAHVQEHSEVHKLQYEIDGHPAAGEWHPRTGKATAVMMVARRFRVSLNGERITPQVIRQYFESLDTKQMAAWATPSTATPE